jgi:hypothetical protein
MHTGQKTLVKEIGNSAFLNSGIKSIRIPTNVENIGKECFYYCKPLCELVFESDSKLKEIAFFIQELRRLFGFYYQSVLRCTSAERVLSKAKSSSSLEPRGERLQMTTITITNNFKIYRIERKVQLCQTPTIEERIFTNVSQRSRNRKISKAYTATKAVIRHIFENWIRIHIPLWDCKRH